jgi:NADH-quinone oxidoreductase subunit J
VSAAAFGVFAVVAIGSALGLVLKKNAIHGALFLVVNLATVAALYLSLGAEFLAAAQVIVYAGAIMVLFVFAIMVLIPGKEETGPDPRRPYRVLAVPVGVALLAELALIVVALRRAGPVAAPAAPPGGVEAVGRLLFTDYLFPFELTSVLLLAAMVGVLVLARRRPG